MVRTTTMMLMSDDAWEKEQWSMPLGRKTATENDIRPI